jgi:ketosteroid isomerase-like protein
MATEAETLETVRKYHAAWVRKDFAAAATLLSARLEVEVPINSYPTKESFVEALAGFVAMAKGVKLLSECVNGGQAMLLYDMDVEGLGTFRVAEHFTVENGLITRIRQIHDTYAIRKAGFAGE